VGERLLKERLEESGINKTVLPWQVYTDKDIMLATPDKQPSNLISPLA
jgi:hypothetical protein